MSKLELVPAIDLMIIQGALFGVAALIVKTKFVTPYLKLKEKKDAMTVGDSTNASNILEECDQKSADIQKKIRETFEVIKNTRAKSKTLALEQQKKLIDTATHEAETHLKKISKEIDNSYQAELGKLQSVIKPLTEQMYQSVIS